MRAIISRVYYIKCSGSGEAEIFLAEDVVVLLIYSSDCVFFLLPLMDYFVGYSGRNHELCSALERFYPYWFHFA